MTGARAADAGEPRRLEVEVDPLRCVGNAMCLSVAPRTFRHNEARQSEAADPPGDPAQAVIEAAESCPTAAITVRDAATGEVLAP